MQNLCDAQLLKTLKTLINLFVHGNQITCLACHKILKPKANFQIISCHVFVILVPDLRMLLKVNILKMLCYV